MTTPPTTTTGDTPVPAERPQDPSVDIDGELQLAALRRQFADEEGQGVSFREWEVERRLGSGGMGTVYLARDPRLDRRVALKVVRPGVTGEARAKELRVIREAQALARLNHDNVLKIHQVDTSGERAVIEMEYVDGPTLREWQSRPGRGWRAIVAAYVGAGEGLAAVHRAEILHRDIKPDNLLVDANDRVKVADLGLAVAIRSEAGERDEASARAGGENSVLGLKVTAEGAWVGTPGYMAPEILAGAEASEASDQFSLAVSLYEAVYGARPFCGDSPQELAAAMHEGTLARPRDKGWRPWWLARALRRALRFDPGRRYPSVAAFVAVLRRRLRMRLWFGAGVGALVLLTGSSTAVWLAKPPPPDPCADAGAEMRAVWNDELRAELQRRAEAAASPQAVRALELLVGTLDDRARAWVETRTQLCLAEGKREPVAAELDARQRACLRYTRINIEAVVAQLRAGREELARHYTESAAAVEALPSCEDRGQLEHWPLDDADDDVDTVLAQALALEAAGRYPEAEALARRVAERGEGRDPLRRAEALYRLGHILGLQRRAGQAFEVLDEARNAAFTLGHDELFCRAAAFQAKLMAGVPRDAALAARELGLAHACVERVGARSPILRADLLEARGLLAQAAGDPEAAITWHEQALALRRDHLGDEHLITTQSLHNLANAIAEAEPGGARAAEVRRLYADCLEVRTRLLGEEHPKVADIRFDLGDVLRLEGELDEGRRQLELAEKLYTNAPGEHEAVRAKIHLALAVMDIESSELDSAETHLEQARALLGEERFVELEQARWLHLDGALALRRQNLLRAAESSRRATRLYRRHDPHGSEALDSLIDEIEATYGLGDFARIAALVRDEGSLLLAHLRSLPASERGPRAWYIGAALREQAVWADAITYLELAMESYSSLGDSGSAAELRAALDRAEAQLQHEHEHEHEHEPSSSGRKRTQP